MTGLRLLPNEVLELPRQSTGRIVRTFVSGGVFFGCLAVVMLAVWCATGSR